MMKTYEKVIVGLFVVQLAVFSAIYKTTAPKRAGNFKMPVVLHISPEKLIGKSTELLGNAHAGYTLVEFGDYQCPPCAATSVQVKSLIAEYPDELRFRFRQYPLEMHEYAMNCALIAEKSRELGYFYEVHDNLYRLKTKVSPAQVKSMLSGMNLDINHLSERQNKAADDRVKNDMEMGHSLDVNSTPTFLLCCPDGRVLKLGSLSQAESLIK